VANENGGKGQDATSAEFASGQKLFRRYTLKRTLGRGGMGIVWLARDDELERDVALKFLPDLIIHDRAVLSDLKRETRRSLELTHKNIVRIYDFVHDEKSGCISMEYVDGDTLSNLRADRPRKIFEPQELKEWMSQLCDALDYAHTHARIVHRDLKPTNLMVNQRGELKVADFGIARSLSDSMSMLTMDRGKSGTLLYMSPQQLDGERGNHLDDVYSLGASMYELLTSKPPFYSGNVDRQIKEKVPPSMTQRRKEFEIVGEPVDETWEEVVSACLAKDPARRPQSVSDVAKRLEVPSPKTRRAERDASREPGKSGTLVGAVIVILIVAACVWYFGFRNGGQLFQDMVSTQPAAPIPAPTIATEPAAPVVPAFGSVIVDTVPSGATVTLGGEEARKSPTTFREIRPGKYPARIVLDGYDPVERQVEVKEGRVTDLGTITLPRAKAVVELNSVPAGAKVLQNGAFIGTTPLRRDDLPIGEATFLVAREGYLPRELKANIDPKQGFKQDISLTQAAPIYQGTIRVRYDYSAASVPLTMTLASDLKSGTMSQSGKRGDFVVKFTGVWDGTVLHAVTGEVLSQPAGIRWTPESFTLRFGDDGKGATYECVADGKSYIAELSAQSPESTSVARTAPVYKGTIRTQGDSSGAGRPVTINFSGDRRSGTMTQSSKSGDVVVRFNGVWDGTTLRAVTGEVISKPKNIKWDPESFTLRFDGGGRGGSYECNADGHVYIAQLSAP
jgi:hypothetical protein